MRRHQNLRRTVRRFYVDYFGYLLMLTVVAAAGYGLTALAARLLVPS